MRDLITGKIVQRQRACHKRSLKAMRLALAQPAISQPYEYPKSFIALNLDAMTPEFSLGQGGPDDNPTTEFEVGQQFENKEDVLMAVKTYSIRKQEKWEVTRYNGPHSCIQTSMGQDHEKLDSKVIAGVIFTMVKADPAISIRVLQGC
ncbi:hypothetical protein PIB30_055270 [Stylosanthes scabra]|uniref:Uncharacterized protein n=1 Tax=Stylosanthes scabra TaxID=79078 RepID=A0ABU6TL79_9FABA|nr:hypothetical protein [Stylosanthes scabra]